MVCSIYVTENFGNLYRKYETTFCLYHRKFNYSELVNDRVKENNKLLADQSRENFYKFLWGNISKT